MPPTKQPSSLHVMAMDVLVKAAVRFCEQRAVNGSSAEFRRGICALVKADMCSRLPWHFFAEFTAKFVTESHSKKYKNWKARDALDVLIDVDIVGLRLTCIDQFLDWLDYHHLHRLRRIVVMSASSFRCQLAGNIDVFYLNDLTTLYFLDCTDDDLTTIGKNCSKLQYLDIQETEITDQGLCALSPCQELRFVGINSCPKISHLGINHLISVLAKLQALACGDRYESVVTDSCNGFDFLNYMNEPCLTMKGFNPYTHAVENVDLPNMVTKFPNLEFFEICSYIEDFSALTSLRSLTGLRIVFDYQCSNSDVDRAWQSLKEVLRSVGENMKNLQVFTVGSAFIPCRASFNFIFKNCRNIVELILDYESNELDIPQFPNLKVLRLYGYRIDPADDRAFLELKYSKLLNLEILALCGFRISFETVKSMMFDHKRLPRLTELRSSGLTEHEVKEIRRIARHHNLDFVIHMTSSS